MESAVTVAPAQLPALLLHLAVVRPVFLWGPPGSGKSSLVRDFARSLGLPCVTLLGTQLAPEDLNAASAEVQKAFYPLILDRRIGGYELLAGVRREHAYLVPAGARLPFTPRGPVFEVR